VVVDWAAPDVTAAGGTPPTEPAPWATPTAAPPAPPELDRLAPRTVPDILDGGFAILKRAPATVIGFTAALVIPVQALGAWLNRGVEGVSFDDLLAQSDTSFQIGDTGTANGAAAFVLQIGPMLVLVFVAAALARLVSAWYVGHDLTLSELLRGSLTRGWALVAAFVLVHLAEMFALVGFLVFSLAVMTWFLVTAPVIGAEGSGPIVAMRRSARLVSRRFWVVLGVALLSFLIEILFETAIGLVPTMLSLWLGTDGVGWVLSAMVSILTQLITIPVVAGITVSLYLDLRVRTEGLDLELDAIEAFPPAA
jgi:hypothetical protein